MGNRILAFKDFDIGDYEIDDRGKAKKKDNLLKKIGKKIYKISTSEELRWAAGLLLTVYLMSGKHKSTSDDTAQVLSDIHSGRMDYTTLEKARDVVVDTYETMKGSSKGSRSSNRSSIRRPSRHPKRY
jgi:hypothetical protein